MHRADGFFHVPRRADDSLLPLPRIERTCPTQPRQFHADARPGLADLIVQFAADQPPLVFVRREPLPGQQPHFLLHELRLIEQHRSFLRALPEGELPGPPRPDRALKPAITPEQRDRPPLPPIFLRLAVATRLAGGPMQPLDRRERRAENAGPAAEPGTQPGPFPARSPRTPGAWSCSRTKSSVSKPCAITSRPLGRRLPPCNLRRHSGVGARADKVALRSCGGGCGHGGGSGRCLFRRPIDSKIAADWDKIALQGNATAARKGAPAEITYAEYLAPERRAGLLRSMQAAPPPASTGETFAEKFCRHFNVPPDRFEKEVLRKALYPLARYFRRLLPDYMRAADRSFVAGIGRLRHRRDLALEVAEFQRDPRNQSFSRNRLRLRISARRMQHLVEAVWGETPTPPRG